MGLLDSIFGAAGNMLDQGEWERVSAGCEGCRPRHHQPGELPRECTCLQSWFNPQEANAAYGNYGGLANQQNAPMAGQQQSMNLAQFMAQAQTLKTAARQELWAAREAKGVSHRNSPVPAAQTTPQRGQLTCPYCRTHVMPGTCPKLRSWKLTRWGADPTTAPRSGNLTLPVGGQTG